MPRTVGNAQYFPWDGGSIFVGRSGVFPVHAHQAIQICFLFDGCIRLRARDDAPWVDYGIAVVPSQQPHGMDGSGVQYGAVVFVEPETREGRMLTERCSGAGITSADRSLIAPVLPDLVSAVRERRGREAIVTAARRLVQALTRESEPSVVSDERIIRAVAYINSNLQRAITLEQVAAVAHLSPSRFRHLFAEQTGTGLRPYILWRRFVSVWEHTMRGASLSEAAHAAGFADSAHLTRTCRRMMGIPPSLFDVSGTGPADE
ncbi:MAG: helix-turn-helix transcriptional regulator [Chromatiales bacterium]|nr:helix-turn-helix transcriptional regulator [Chromatiales bacterium]